MSAGKHPHQQAAAAPLTGHSCAMRESVPDKGLAPPSPGTRFFIGSICGLPQEALEMTHFVKKDKHGKHIPD